MPLAYGSIGGYSGSARCSSNALPSRHLRSSLLVGNDMDGGLLCTCCGAVDADIDAHEVGIHIRPDAFVGIDQPAGTFRAHFTIVEDFLIYRRVRIGLRNLLIEPLVQGFVLAFTNQR